MTASDKIDAGQRPGVLGPDDVVLGFDPGGGDRFGAALLQGTSFTATTVRSVAEAHAWALAVCGGRAPVAAGIDTLLHWSDGPGGWRPADKALRSAYPPASSSVLSPNALYGSMVIGGMALAIRLRETWNDILLNETHPKVLFFALAGWRYRETDVAPDIDWFITMSGLDVPHAIKNDHELDALISAWATRTGLKDWPDLVGRETGLICPAGRVSYFWPPAIA